ncbi:hypothetical protein BLOT_002159, partial [Blomia tropicalis]
LVGHLAIPIVITKPYGIKCVIRIDLHVFFVTIIGWTRASSRDYLLARYVFIQFDDLRIRIVHFLLLYYKTTKSSLVLPHSMMTHAIQFSFNNYY